MKAVKKVLVTSLATMLFGTCAYAAPVLQTHGDYNFENHRHINAWLEIDVNAFEQNIALLQSRLSKDTKICAIVKADAYGNGVDLLMPSIIKMKVPCIGIASNEEARVARAHGYQGVISRVRNATADEVEAGLNYDIQELIGGLEQAKLINQIATNANKTISYHLALNAGGMDRNGLDLSVEQGRQDVLRLLNLPNLNLAGIMTHYAFEEEDFVRERLKVFHEQVDWLIDTTKLDRKKLTLHTANSFATIKVPESHLDMVRPGGLIYGDTVSSDYQPIMSFKTKVASVQFYKKGTTVGYDGTHTLMRDSYLANLPFGYSDGYRRAFTNKGVVLIGGERVPVVGKVSMNTTMVDVTDVVHKVQAGDEVVIYGKQGNNAISQAEIEDINDALLADLYTIWGNSNPKLIKQTQ